jgi:L-alanine-DL-glutamate epimerase-like enolase superfamily enzyme
VEEGYNAIKVNFFQKSREGKELSHIKTTGAFDRDQLHLIEERLALAREVCGPDMDIIMENHAMTDYYTALQTARIGEKYDIMFLEEPLTPLNAKVWAKLAQNTTIPLATGERMFTRWGFVPMFENGSMSVAQPDVGNCGGVTECKKICDMAHAYDVVVQTHVCSSPISVAVSLQLEAAIPNFIIHEHHISNTLDAVTGMGKYNYQPVKGYMDVPELPGIGQELSDYALKNAVIETVQ